MVAHYEQLRADALDPGEERVLTPGLALFLRRGMAAWIEAWPQAPERRLGASAPDYSDRPRLPLGLRQQISLILAGMILAQRQEVSR
jgi:hypothetical protein